MWKMIALKKADSNLLFEKYLKFWTIQAWKILKVREEIKEKYKYL